MRCTLPQVPDEREIPETIPFREVEHDERDEFPDDWAFRSYPMGSARDGEVWADQATWDAFVDELHRREEARKKLGGFGFRA